MMHSLEAEKQKPPEPVKPKTLANKRLQDTIVRKGNGITGVGTAFINPLISGRSTLYKLYRMQDKRVEDQAFAEMPNDELDKMRQLLQKKDKLNERREQLQSGVELMNEKDKRKNLKNIARDQSSQKREIIQELKYNFQHINGMWPKTAKFDNQQQRLQSWQTDLVIKRKIFKPSKRLIFCEQEVEKI